MKQTAKFNGGTSKNNISTHRKENSFFCEYAVHIANVNGLETPIIARFYGGKKGAAIHCCVWVKADTSANREIYTSGGGKAGGYGYHKSSAALSVALNYAGFTLSEPIDGRGDEAMNGALRACAVALGYTDEDHIFIHTAHA